MTVRPFLSCLRFNLNTILDGTKRIGLPNILSRHVRRLGSIHILHLPRRLCTTVICANPPTDHEIYQQRKVGGLLCRRSQTDAHPDIFTTYSDILSFYKEDLDGESVNRISFLAAQSGRSKQAILRDLVEEAVAAHNNVLEILAPHPEALAAFRAFVPGYIGFHSSAKRYRLEELNL
jgi:hypothetical protein